MNKTQIEDVITLQLEDREFEEILCDFDLTPVEVFQFLYQAGLIDDDILETYDACIK